MRINGVEQGLDMPYIAGFRVNTAECLMLSNLALAPEVELAFHSYISDAKPFVDISRVHALHVTNALQDRISASRSNSRKNVLLATVLETEGTSLLVDRIIHHYVKPQSSPKQEALAMLQGFNRVMTRPDMLTRPL